MSSRTAICVLFAAGVALGCASHGDEGPSGAAGQPSAGVGTMSEAGRANVGGEGGHADTSAAGGSGASAVAGMRAVAGMSAIAGASAMGGTGGNETSAAGGGSAGALGGGAGSGGAATTCQLPLTTGDHSHLDAMEHVGTYSVSGSTAQQLRQSINANRGHDYDALTTWNIMWSFQNCASPVWTVSLDIEYDLPQWDAPPSANAALVASWEHYMAALDCHEYGHGKLALDCANQVYDALTALHAGGTCDAVSAAGDATFQDLLDQCQAREVSYDADTMHGATMGAVFP